MSKDPAILFYTSDFITGTLTMTDAQRGKYIILLCLQHQQGFLTEEDMLNICKTYDEKVFSKFEKDKLGYYYNPRMKQETDKRHLYIESRRRNRSKEKNISSTYDTTYVKHMENENINKKKEEVIRRRKKPFIPPALEEVRNYFKENGFRDAVAIKAFNYYSSADWKDSKGEQILNWKQKMIGVWFKDENKIIQNAVVPEFHTGPSR